MNRHIRWPLVLCATLFLGMAATSEELSQTGIVKGRITIDGKPTSDVVVSVEGLPPENVKSQKSRVKTEKAVMDQRNKRFSPRVLPVLVGTTVDFPNNDNTWHNVFSKSEAREFDLGLYPSGQSRSVTFDKPGVVRILCNVHPRMEAYILVQGHPHFSAADSRGNYRVDAVPLGKYRLEVWHPELGVKTVSFNLAREGEVLGIDIDLKKK
jgi:plastocyanin